jgi:uncharacterized alpha-E superfamily protein
MSRYLERAEHMARLLDLNLSLLDQSNDGAEQRWQWLLASLRANAPETLSSDAYRLTEHLTFNLRHQGSLVACITAARENARQVREQISSEMWVRLNQLYLRARQAKMNEIYAQPHEFFRPIKEGSHLFQGLTDSTMNHGEGWHFIQLGRYIERAGATATLLDVHLRALLNPAEPAAEMMDGAGGGTDYLTWVALLKSCTAFEAYCQAYTADLRPERIAEFLLLNAESPRSVRFAAERIEAALLAIAKTSGKGRSGRTERLAGKLRATLGYAQMDEIIADDIHSYLEDIQFQCALIHNAVQQQYIAYPVEVAIAS